MTPTLFSYLPAAAAHAICKLAEPQPTPTPTPTPSVPNKSRAKELLAMGIGTLAGGGAAHYAHEGYKKLTGNPLPLPYAALAAPVIGAGLGLAYNMAKARQLEETQRAVQDRDH